MKFLKSRYSYIFLLILCGTNILYGSTVFILNKTGKPIWLEAKYIPWGLLFPYKKVGFWVPEGKSTTLKAYRVGWLRLRNNSQFDVDVSKEKVVISRVISIKGDTRISSLCDKFIQETELEKKSYCRTSWIKQLKVELSKDGEMIFNQPVLEDVAIPLRLVVTRHKNGNDFIVTEVGVGRALDQMFKPGKFFEYLIESDITSVK